MISKILANFQLYNYPLEFVGDFFIKEIVCPACNKIRYKLHISEYRPVTTGDSRLPQIAVSYNTPSPRGRLGERKRNNPFGIKLYDVVNDNKELLVAVGKNINFRFLTTKRHYNPNLWDTINTIHIYEDHYEACVLWAEADKDGDFELKNDYIIEIKRLCFRCEKNLSEFKVGCKKFRESEDVLVYVNNDDEYYIFEPGGYYTRNKIYEIFNAELTDRLVKEFNEKSKFFSIGEDDGYYVKLIKKGEE